MNCKNCEYAIKSRSLQDNEWYTRCTYEEGECVKIAELEDKLANADYQLEGRDNEISKLTQQIEKMRCCGNCSRLCECGIRGYEECKNHDKWELKEIKEK